MNIIKCTDKHQSSQKALELLKNSVDKDSLLLLSGGTSPEKLYKLITQERTLIPGGVALIDERFGARMHDHSNEKMMVDAGLVEWFLQQGIPFYPILKDGVDLVQTAWEYEETLKSLFVKFPKKIAVMGIGADGHTSGIKPGLEYDPTKWVVGYDDVDGPFEKRITTTLECLEQIDQFLVLVFGEGKRIALQKVLNGVDQDIMPAGFYKTTAAAVTVITDINVIV